MPENSPAFQRWDRGLGVPSPEGTAENHKLSRPFGTQPSIRPHPALKRWAILFCPAGTKTGTYMFFVWATYAICVKLHRMKNKLLIALAVMALSLSTQRGYAAEKTAAAEFKDLEAKIQAKLQEGKKTEQDLAPELKEFDDLIARHKGAKTDEVAEILLLEAKLYLQVFDNTDKGIELIKQLQRDFPETTVGQNAYKMLDAIKQQAEAKRIQSSLVPGKDFPSFDEKDVAGKPLSLTHYKGKVVLIDFWATWCGPCVNELPNVLKTYEKYHAKGFEIIGISLDDNAQKLAGFTKEKNMAWQQFFDGQGWLNKLAVKYGVHSIPATYLLDGEGKIIGKDLGGDELEKAVAKALIKN